ncbi:MAG: DUF6072 family protein [Acidobacteriota bacterium]
MSEPNPLTSAVKVAGEAFVAPGSSLILDGKIGPGALHLVGGLAAKALIGPIGLFLVAANSYSESVTQKGLIAHAKGVGQDVANATDGDPNT